MSEDLFKFMAHFHTLRTRHPVHDPTDEISQSATALVTKMGEIFSRFKDIFEETQRNIGDGPVINMEKGKMEPTQPDMSWSECQRHLNCLVQCRVLESHGVSSWILFVTRMPRCPRGSVFRTVGDRANDVIPAFRLSRAEIIGMIERRRAPSRNGDAPALLSLAGIVQIGEGPEDVSGTATPIGDLDQE